ncbi:MAG TPA: hypothetical protein VFY93_00165 [Planctomycetota bacterium]|nr:hypothetical protein [Planctomycetota bacterium]
MILNPFSVVAAFAAVLRVVLGLLLLLAGILALRAWRRARGRNDGSGEGRFYLLVAASATLTILAVVSWPLLYLVLRSYVPLWPGVMCIEGVTRIGEGSIGAPGLLPHLLRALAVTKPLLIFASGAWLVLHLVNRGDRTGARTGRVLAALLLFAFLSVADGAIETAYLFLPKQEKTLAAGCCGEQAAAEPSRGGSLPVVASDAGGRTLVSAAFLATGALLVLALTAAIRRGGAWLAVSLVGALLSLPIGLVFLVDVAAPGFLHLPYHHCVYCLARWMPETLVGVLLYVLGAFGAGWAFAARRPGKGGGAGEGVSVPLLRMARFSYLGALLMAAVMLGNA